MKLKQLDHLVLTVKNIDTSIDFYTRVLAMEAITFGDNRKALKFGPQKINLHQQGNEFEPKARCPQPGSADLCLLADIPIGDVISHFERYNVPVETGPVARTGANGPILSVYIRDPDGNLLEIANEI